MKKEVELRLIPGPGAKPEFLAVVALKDDGRPAPACFESLLQNNNNNTNNNTNNRAAIVVLEGYTRDAWALDTATKWEVFQVMSVDGRNKLPGFVNHLRERKKTAFGRIPDGRVWVVPHKQMSSTTLTCRVAAIPKIPNCPLQPLLAVAGAGAAKPPPQVAAAAPSTTKTGPPPSSNNNNATTRTNNPNAKKKKGFGFLGNLVGAQKRTNQQVEAVAAKKVIAGASETTATTATSSSTTGDSAASSTRPAAEELKTAGQVLAEFRQEMEQQMLDFDLAPDVCLKVKIDVATKLKLLSDQEKHSGRVTMEILKYIVYEQAEEVNDEWIAQKEASEFMDEVVIAIYKEGEAPPEVLEDMNKADLPDEVKGQQRAIQQEQQKAQLQREQKLAKFKQAQALKATDDDFAVLNTKKRDRRTIEDYQRAAKRERVD
jgi:hypothetical protein